MTNYIYSDISKSVEEIRIKAEIVKKEVSHAANLMNGEHYQATAMIIESLYGSHKELQEKLKEHFDLLRKLSSEGPRTITNKAKEKVRAKK